MARSKNSSFRQSIVAVFFVLLLSFASNWLVVSSDANSKSAAMSANQAVPLTDSLNMPIEASGPCSCIDKGDLLNRYLYDIISAHTYEEYADATEAQEKRDARDLDRPLQPIQMFSAEGWAAIQNQLSQSINKNYNQPNTLGS